MSKNLNKAASTQFDSDVNKAYTGMPKLTPTVTNRTGVIGDTYTFRNMGRGMAKRRGAPQTNVTPMNVTHTRVPCVLENWIATEYTDIFDEPTVNFQERLELAEVIGTAIGLREDQLVIDACIAIGTYGSSIAANFGGNGLNVTKLRRINAYYTSIGVGSDLHIMADATGKEEMLGDAQATSSDYASVKALVNGEINTFMGFTFHWIETRQEGGLPTNTGFAYHKPAVGTAAATLKGATVDWSTDKESWKSSKPLKMGAVSRRDEGVVEINLRT